MASFGILLVGLASERSAGLNTGSCLGEEVVWFLAGAGNNGFVRYFVVATSHEAPEFAMHGRVPRFRNSTTAGRRMERDEHGG
jgi:hypothetical protein